MFLALGFSSGLLSEIWRIVDFVEQLEKSMREWGHILYILSFFFFLLYSYMLYIIQYHNVCHTHADNSEKTHY